MKKKLLAIVLITTCNHVVYAQDTKEYKTENFNIRTYSTRFDQDVCRLDSIVISKLGSGRRKQSITLAESRFFCNSTTGPIMLDDYNFDGAKDIRFVLLSTGANGDSYFWLLDRKSSNFIRSKELEKIDVAKVNPKSKTILSYYSEDAATDYENVYKWMGTSLQKI